MKSIKWKLVDYGINVFIYDDKSVRPHRTTKRQDDNIMNLLIIKEGVKEHYVYIKKLDVLVSPNRRDEEGRHISKQAYPCPNRLHSFSSQFLLTKHLFKGVIYLNQQRQFFHFQKNIQ